MQVVFLQTQKEKTQINSNKKQMKRFLGIKMWTLLDK